MATDRVSSPGPDALVLGDGQTQVLEMSGETTTLRLLLRDLVRHRGLAFMLAGKDFNSRYRSASFGVLWSVLLPLLQGAVMAFIFGHVVRIRLGGGDDFKIYVMSGTLTWSYFSNTLQTGSTSIVDQGGIAGKVYFPRLILPTYPALTNVIGLAISYLVLLLLMLVFHSPFHMTLLLLPVATIVLAALAVAAGAVTSIGHVYFRDVRYIVSAAITLLFYATPILYPLARAPHSVQKLLAFNPASGGIQLVHFAVFGHADDIGLAMESTAVWIVVLTILSLIIYRRYERVACDRL